MTRTRLSRRPRGAPARARAKTKVDARQDRKIARISRVLNTRELKFQDQSQQSQVPNWAGVLTNVFAPAQGQTDIARAGDKVSIEKIDFRINAGMTAAGSNQLRIMLIRDKANGIGTAVSNVLDNSALSSPNAAQGPIQEDQRHNFEILYDKTVLLDSVQHYQMQDRFRKRWKKPKQVIFNNNSTTVNSGQIKLLLVSDLLLPNIAVDWYCRIWYSDM